MENLRIWRVPISGLFRFHLQKVYNSNENNTDGNKLKKKRKFWDEKENGYPKNWKGEWKGTEWQRMEGVPWEGKGTEWERLHWHPWPPCFQETKDSSAPNMSFKCVYFLWNFFLSAFSFYYWSLIFIRRLAALVSLTFVFNFLSSKILYLSFV